MHVHLFVHIIQANCLLSDPRPTLHCYMLHSVTTPVTTRRNALSSVLLRLLFLELLYPSLCLFELRREASIVASE